jgi:glutathione S-transferase
MTSLRFEVVGVFTPLKQKVCVCVRLYRALVQALVPPAVHEMSPHPNQAGVAFKRLVPTAMERASYAGCELYGWLVSPYTAKVRSMLAYKQIHFSDLAPSALQMRLKLQPAVGRPIMPSVRLADGSWRQDSALICDEIEKSHPEFPTTPPGAAQKLASSLLELHGDEWLPAVALHYRWDLPENKEWAVREFGRCAFPLLPSALSSALMQPLAGKMQSFRRVQGISPSTHAGIEAFAASLIAQLDAHLAHHPFLLGGAACRGDFSLYGPLWAHCYRDPSSRDELFGGAPNVIRWMERLHGHDHDPAFPGMPAATRDEPPAAAGDFLPSDAVPETLDPLFRTIFAEQWPFLASLSLAIDEHVRASASGGGAPPPARLPRALGYAPFHIGGASGERRLVTYQAWRLQRPLDEYAALALAPSRDLELRRVDAWLDRIGGGAREALSGLRPEVRLERDGVLPQSQDVLRPECLT